jgi:hypothetical protein
MKNAEQVREYVRRRWLEENYNGDRATPENRAKALAFGEVLAAFDTPHKTPLKMPKEIKLVWRPAIQALISKSKQRRAPK